MGSNRPSMGVSYSSQGAVGGQLLLGVFGGFRTGAPPTAWKGRDRQHGDHPTQELPGPTPAVPQGGSSSYHWQGAWGGGCQSPRLLGWNWSCHLICCVGREANGAVSGGVGVRAGEACSLTGCLPSTPLGDSPAPRVTPTGGWALRASGQPLSRSPSWRALLWSPARHLELRRFWRSFCSCRRRRLSSLTGLGMKPTSQPSFTSRPIHQSLLYFCRQPQQVGWERTRGSLEGQASSHPRTCHPGPAKPLQGVAPPLTPQRASPQVSEQPQDLYPLRPQITPPPAGPHPTMGSPCPGKGRKRSKC